MEMREGLSFCNMSVVSSSITVHSLIPTLGLANNRGLGSGVGSRMSWVAKRMSRVTCHGSG